MRTAYTIIFALCLPLLLSGCAYALAMRNRETQVKLRLDGASTAQCRLQLGDDRVVVHHSDESGRVEFVVPPMQSGCRVYLFGVLKVADHSAAARRVLHVCTEDRIVSRLSLQDIERLPLDDDGYRVLKTR